MNGNDRDYLLDRLEDILHDNHCLEYKDEICNSLCKYIISNNRELKSFNLEDAKAGKPVCTRDGRKARIICFDKKYIRPIVALVDHWDEADEEVEGIIECHNDGYYNCREIPSPNDLMMLPEKKEGWVNVYKIKESTFGYITSYFDTEENAKEDKEQLPGYVATVKINWSE